MPWDTTVPTFTATAVPHTDLNKLVNNVMYLKSPDPVYHAQGDGSADFTTSVATFTSLGAPFEYTHTFARPGKVLLIGRGDIRNSSNIRHVYMDFDIDGTRLGQANGIAAWEGSEYGGFIMRWVTVTAGSHTFKWVWRVESVSDTATLRGTTRYPLFYVRQISFTP